MNAIGTSKWPTVALGDVCDVIMGQAPSGASYNNGGKGVPLIAGASDFKNGRPEARKFTTQPTKLSNVGDIVLGIRATIGIKVISDDAYCLGRGVAGLRAKPDLSTRYLWHLLDSLKDELASKAKGATFLQVSRADITSLSFPLPPLEEQKRIAAILDKANALRRKRRDALALLDTLTQSIFVEMFGDPVRNPKGWPIVKLGSIGELDRGKSKHRPRNDPALLGGDHPLIQTGDVAASGGRITSYSSTYSEIGLKQSKKWPKGTLCITIAANIADTGILEFDACFPDSVVAFSHSDEFMTEYVQVWLSFLKKNLDEMAPQAAQKNINLKILRDLEMPLPDTELLVRFAASLKTLHHNHDQQMEIQKRSDDLYAALQSRAFSGEL